MNVRTRHRAVKAASLIVALAGATSFSLATPAAASAPAGVAYAMAVAPRESDPPIIRYSSVAVMTPSTTDDRVVFPDPKPKVVSDVPPTSTDGDVPPASTDNKDEFPEPKPRVVSDLPPTSTDGDVPPMSTDNKTEFPEPRPRVVFGYPA